MRVFLLGLAVIAVIATFYATPKLLRLEYNLSINGTGSALDKSAAGHYLVYEAIRGKGFRTALSLGDAAAMHPRSIVVALLEPTKCPSSAVNGLLDGLWSLSREGYQVSLVVDGTSCGSKVLAGFARRYYIKRDVYPGAVYAYDAELRRGFAALGAATVNSVELFSATDTMAKPRVFIIAPQGALESIRQQGVSNIVGLELKPFKGPRIVVILVDEAFQNALIEAAERHGLDNLGYITSLLESLSTGPASSVIVFPSGFYSGGHEALSAALKLHPAMITLFIVKSLRGAEDAVLSAIRGNSPALFASLAMVSLLVYILVSRGIRPGLAPQEEPASSIPVRRYSVVAASTTLEALLQRGTLLSKSEALYAVKSLYEAVNDVLKTRLGASIEEIIRDPLLLGKVPLKSPGDRERSLRALRRLYVLYTRKVESKRLFPIVLSWSRELEEIILGLEPLLSSLGTGLLEERGIERALLA